MSKFSKNFCGKSPVKQYKEDVVINDSNAAENLKKLEYSKISDGSMDPAITKEHIEQTEKEFAAKQKQAIDPNSLEFKMAENQRWANQAYGGVELLGTGVEYVAGGGGLIKGLVILQMLLIKGS